jgi:hypothetical protein
MAWVQRPELLQAEQHGFAAPHSAAGLLGILSGSTRRFALSDVARLLAER